MPTFVKNILDKVDAVKNEDAKKPQPEDRTRATIACGTVGAVTAIAIGYSAKWNLFYSGIGGALAGIIICRLFIKPVK